MTETSMTTVFMTPGEPGRMSMSMRPDSYAHVSCSTYPDRGPILSISHGGASVDFSTGRRQLADIDLRFARQLAEHTAAYLAECERLYAEQSAETSAA